MVGVVAGFKSSEDRKFWKWSVPLEKIDRLNTLAKVVRILERFGSVCWCIGH